MRKKIPHLTTKTAIKKAKAVEFWRETQGNISKLCRAIPIERQTFYRWMKNDPNFAISIFDAEGELNDDVRDVLIQKAADGDMTAVIFYLKNRHPDYLQKPVVAQQFNVDGDLGVKFSHDGS